MLDPDHRALYTDALRPPPGFRFREAVATTYSLDLQTLLTIPLHLALFSAEGELDELLEDGVALLEALRRTTDHVTVYAQAARLLAPRQPQVLFGLLEPAVVEVTAASEAGVFHPKIWLIRFAGPGSGRERFRLLVLSRNITDDRSWDLALTLEGEPGDGPREANEPLARLLERLPELAMRAVPGSRAEATETLAQAVRSVEWELPDGYEELHFHALGLDGGGGWTPEPGGKLAVVSPFLSDAALRALLDETKEPVALLSRPEELAAVDPELLQRFGRVLTLAEEAEREDGEEPAPTRGRLHPGNGLHAKAYLVKRGWDTYLYVGSANATNPALVHGTNVEFMAELVGKRSRVGAVEDLLDPDGLGALCVDYLPDEDSEDPDPEEESAEAALEAARRELAASGLRLTFSDTGDGTWAMTLEADHTPGLDGVEGARAWLVSRQDGTAADVLPLAAGRPVEVRPAPVALLTSFVVFELTAEAAPDPARFVLSVEARGLPTEARDAAIVRHVIRNRDGFLRYVMLLLAEAGEDAPVFGKGSASWLSGQMRRSDDDVLPLFEHMTRAFCRDPERLDSVERLLTEMGARTDGAADGPESEEVVPADFLELWRVFRGALDEEAGP